MLTGGTSHVGPNQLTCRILSSLRSETHRYAEVAAIVELKDVSIRKKQLIGIALVATALLWGVVATLPARTHYNFLKGSDKRATLLEPSTVGHKVYEVFQLDKPVGQVVEGCRAELGPEGFREEITDRGRLWRSGSNTVGLTSSRGFVYVTVGRKATLFDQIRAALRW